MTEPEITVKHKVLNAIVMEYEHGGARIYFEHGPGKGRELICDIYGDGDFRDYILKALGYK